MEKEQGLAHILLVVLLVAGLAGAIYMVQQKTNVFPKAYEETPITVTPKLLGNSKRVFITSRTYNGDLGGITGGDAKCQERADTVNLGGVWKAWLSDDNTSASDRLTHSDGQYKLLNGEVIAQNWADLTKGGLQHQIDISETGGQIAATIYELGRYPVWTGTLPNGRSIADYVGGRNRGGCKIKPCQPLDWTCLNWTDSSYGNVEQLARDWPKDSNFAEVFFRENTVIGLVGQNSSPPNGEGSWTGIYRSHWNVCGSQGYLYCFEQ